MHLWGLDEPAAHTLADAVTTDALDLLHVVQTLAPRASVRVPASFDPSRGGPWYRRGMRRSDEGSSVKGDAHAGRVAGAGVAAIAAMLLIGGTGLLGLQSCAQTPEAQPPAGSLGQQPLQAVEPTPQPVVHPEPAPKPEPFPQPQPQPQPFPQTQPFPQPQPEPQPQPQPFPGPDPDPEPRPRPQPRPQPRPMPPT